jgi:GT2 family glycosyltransferase
MPDLFLVDDGSSDGTAEAVKQTYSGVKIFRGDGNLFWCSGTRLAFSQAMAENYDLYLWLNDDTYLETDALWRLLGVYADAHSRLKCPLIVVGSTRDPGTGLFSYGGWRQRIGRPGTISWEKVPPDMECWTLCDTMNGNCVLISREVVERIGNLDPAFHHGMGDLDYGLRAIKKGCRIVIAPGYYGFCSGNDGTGLWTDVRLPIMQRWRKLLGPKGLPVREWGLFTFRHKGPLWPLVWLSPYVFFWLRALIIKFRVTE